MNENPLGSRISELLNKSGMTQKELAEKIGVTEVSAHRYINGDRNPKGSTIVKIADALGTTSDYLLGLKPGPLKEDEMVGSANSFFTSISQNSSTQQGSSEKDSLKFPFGRFPQLGELFISMETKPFQFMSDINDIINWLLIARELMKNKFDRKLLSRITRGFNKRKYAIVNPYSSIYDFKIDTILPGSLENVSKSSFMIQDCYGIDIGEKYTIVELVKHPSSFDFNFQEFFDMYIKRIIPMMENISEYPIVFITKAYVSTDRFPEDLFYISNKYIDDKDASKKKIKLPIDDILKKEREAFEKLGFVSINECVQYEFDEAFIYPNRIGRKIRAFLLGNTGRKDNDKNLTKGGHDDNA